GWAEFVAAALGRWWEQLGPGASAEPPELLVVTRSTGSPASQVRWWRQCLKRLVKKTGVALTVCHLPPGPTRWTNVLLEMLSQLPGGWAGGPGRAYEVVVRQIGESAGTPDEPLPGTAPHGVPANGDAKTCRALQATPSRFHQEWNYTIGAARRP